MRRSPALFGAALVAVLLSGCTGQPADVAAETPAQLEPSAGATPAGEASADGADFELLCVPGEEPVDAYPPEWTANSFPALPFEVSELCHIGGGQGQQVYSFSMVDEARYDDFAVVAEQWMDDLVSAGFTVNAVDGGFGDYEADSEPVSKYFSIQFVGSSPNVRARVGGTYDEEITLSIHIHP